MAARSLRLIILMIATVTLSRAIGSAQSPRPATKKPAAPASKKPAQSSAFDDLARRAAKASEENRLDEAINLYRQALQLRPSWPEGWWYLGTLYYDTDRYAEALPAFHNLVELNPKLGPAWALLGLCDFETRDYKNSLIHLARSRSLGLGDNRELLNVTTYHEAILLNLVGEFESATDLLNSLIRRGAISADVKIALGLALLRVPLLPTNIDPSKDAVLHDAGEASALVALNNLDQADAAFRRMIKDYATTSFVHYAYAVMLIGLSRYEEAENELREEMRITPDSIFPPMMLAQVYLRTYRYQEARTLAEQALKVTPQSPPAHYLLGRALLEVGNIENSIKELETARRLAPSSPEVRYILARAYAKANRKEDAARERAEFVRLNDLAARQQKQSGPQSYRASSDRGSLGPHEVEEPAIPPPK